MTSSSKTDAELVSDVLGGDKRAFDLLMSRHKSWLYVFIRRHVRSAEDAYDILQESFASAWKALSRYDPERPFDVWIRRIALNKCRDHARAGAVQRRLFSLFGVAQDVAEQTPDKAAPADRASVAGEALARLETAIAALPVQLREPLVLTALQGFSQAEAAETLGIRVKAVETRVYRARKRLAEALDRSDVADVAMERS